MDDHDFIPDLPSNLTPFEHQCDLLRLLTAWDAEDPWDPLASIFLPLTEIEWLGKTPKTVEEAAITMMIVSSYAEDCRDEYRALAKKAFPRLIDFLVDCWVIPLDRRHVAMQIENVPTSEAEVVGLLQAAWARFDQTDLDENMLTKKALQRCARSSAGRVGFDLRKAGGSYYDRTLQ